MNCGILGRYSQNRLKSECEKSLRFEIQSQLRFGLKLVFTDEILAESKLRAVSSYSIGHRGVLVQNTCA